MNFNKHLDLKGKHAPLGASRYHWVNDDREQLINRLCAQYAADVGTIIHNYAASRIEYRLSLSKFEKKDLILELLRNRIPRPIIDRLSINTVFENLTNYVNDCIGFRMTPEVTLFYSDICFGTCDAISYDEAKKQLRIFDLKTGITPARMDQLLIYSALFCMEYHVKPASLESCELRIYQGAEPEIMEPTTDDIVAFCDQIVSGNKLCKDFLYNQLIFEEDVAL